ncbi:hypothetical protein SISSUDRAFT_1060534 [Sistotremastrum suecicum HHB10207 ss-3]|uniref:F-box domain-containing protein n=1 Tax=Sistotremastrum suecicum HHB10207 ss-3 TaxID=1314776 RepID=A0A166F1K6_9AGAM|nr:hypothetical protein SISSUDRAFT_1060534 [Sistotremastrum suecicum HHB10207 ss-3]
MGINVIPLSVLSDILLEVVSDEQDGWPDDNPPTANYRCEDFHAMRLVCSTWNAIIVRDARQWDIISIVEPAQSDLTAIALERARARPITIVIGNDEKPLPRRKWMREACRSMKAYIHRCVRLCLFVATVDVEYALEQWSATPAPLLKDLLLGVPRISHLPQENEDEIPIDLSSLPVLLQRQLPSLTHINVFRVTFDWNDADIPFENLGSLTLGARHDHTIPALDEFMGRCTSLKRFAIAARKGSVLLSSALCSPNLEVAKLLEPTIRITSDIHKLASFPSKLTSLVLCGKFAFTGGVELLLDFLETQNSLQRFFFEAMEWSGVPPFDTLIAPRRREGLGAVIEMQFDVDPGFPEFPFLVLTSFSFPSLTLLRIAKDEYLELSYWSWEEGYFNIAEGLLPSIRRTTFPALKRLLVDVLDPEILVELLRACPVLETLEASDRTPSEHYELFYQLGWEKSGRAGFICPNLTNILFEHRPVDEDHRWSDWWPVPFCFKVLKALVP